MSIESSALQGNETTIKDYTLARVIKSSFWDSIESEDEKPELKNEKEYQQMLSFIR